MRDLCDKSPLAGRANTVKNWVRKANGELRTAAMLYGAERIYGDLERQSEKGTALRRGEITVDSTGEQMSMPFLDLSIVQERLVVQGKRIHALGAADKAAFHAEMLRVIEERCRERGLNPEDITLCGRDFLDEAEVAEMRAAWNG
jgi:hypothetical protein